MFDLEKRSIKLYFVVKMKKFMSKYNTLEVYDWSVMHVVSPDALKLTWLQLPVFWLLGCECLDIHLLVKPASCWGLKNITK